MHQSTSNYAQKILALQQPLRLYFDFLLVSRPHLNLFLLVIEGLQIVFLILEHFDQRRLLVILLFHLLEILILLLIRIACSCLALEILAYSIQDFPIHQMIALYHLWLMCLLAHHFFGYFQPMVMSTQHLLLDYSSHHLQKLPDCFLPLLQSLVQYLSLINPYYF